MTDAPYPYAEAAAKLGVSEDWLRHQTPNRLPHHKFGRTVVFTEDDLDSIRAMHAVTPAESYPGESLRPISRKRIKGADPQARAS